MPGSRYDASARAKAIRLVCEHAGDNPTRWAAMKAVSGRLGMSTAALGTCKSAIGPHGM